MKKNNSKKNIENIIFDLGGVVVDIDFNRAINAFRKLGARDFGHIFSHSKQINVFDRMDRGELSPGEFRDELRFIAKLEISDKQFDDAWNSILIGLTYSRLNLLNEVRKNYNTLLLSNTNVIHIETLNQILKTNFDAPEIQKFFNHAYLSFEIGMRKPEKRIFEYVITDRNIDVSKTLFIDDSAQHIESASALGINTYLFRPGIDQLESLFEEGVLKDT